MKKIALFAGTALALTSLCSTPAYAAPTVAGMALMEGACDAATPPTSSNGKITYNGYVTSGSIVETQLAPTVVTGPLVQVTAAATTPTSLTPATFVTGSEARRGGSPNIHGEFVATATYAGAVFTQSVTTTPRTSYAFSCTFDKSTSGNSGVSVQNGWKTEPASAPLVESGTPVTVTNTIVGDPVVQQFFSDGVICISPGSKGGTWRPQNGYSGALCTTVEYLKLPGKTVTSNSVPNFTPAHGAPEGEVGGGFDSAPFVNAVIDTDPVIEDEVQLTNEG